MRFTSVGKRLIVLGAAAIAVALIGGWFRAGYAREVTLVGITGRHGPTAKRLFRNEHDGERGDRRTGKYKACKDTKVEVTQPIKMTATLAADGKHENMTPTAQEVTDLYVAAYAECFMQGADFQQDENGNQSFQPQHDGKQFTVNNQDIVLHLRPASNVAYSNPNNLQNGYGFIAGDIYNSSTATFTNPDLDGAIAGKHGALLWMGRDNNSHLYAAVIDLAGFPSKTPNPTARDFKAMDTGPLDPPIPYNRTDVAFARWNHTHPATSLHPLIHEGAWVDCDPGCCTASALQALAGPNMAKSASQKRNVAKPTTKAAIPPKKP